MLVEAAVLRRLIWVSVQHASLIDGCRRRLSARSSTGTTGTFMWPVCLCLGRLDFGVETPQEETLQETKAGTARSLLT